MKKQGVAAFAAGCVAMLLLAGCAEDVGTSVGTASASHEANVSPSTPPEAALPSDEVSALDADVSESCAEAVNVLAGTDVDDAGDLRTASVLWSLTACGTSDEYVSAVQDRPEAWGFTQSDVIDWTLVAMVCAKYDSNGTSFVCEDYSSS